MRQLDDDTLDPEIAGALDAIDATLAGDPVDPRYAELAELALLLRAERPEPSPGFAGSLEGRVERRFADGTSRRPRRRLGWQWSLIPAAGLVAAAIVAVVIAVSSGGGGRPQVASSGAAFSGTTASAPAARPSVKAAPTPGRLDQATPSVSPSPGLRLPQNNRKIVQSSQLALSTPPNRIDDVAQEVFDVVGAQSGYVSNSTVTATGGPGGYAEFQLSVPSATLAETMTQLSQLRYARVTSRTDNTGDVTSQFNSANAQLSQAEALRTSLLKQLQNATTQAQISSLEAQLSDANAKIASARSALRSLNHQVNFSQVSLSVEAGSVAAVKHGGGGFTIGKAAHDAGRVLTIAAGAALIALAVLVPLALLGALGWWVAGALRRRRREQALDLA
jgi:hypothetical protein